MWCVMHDYMVTVASKATVPEPYTEQACGSVLHGLMAGGKMCYALQRAALGNKLACLSRFSGC
jgi:hypothetical protein